MNRRNQILSGAILFLLTSGVVFFILRWKPGEPASTATPATKIASPPANPAHEIASLQEDLKKKPKHAPILFRLAELERQSGKTTEAIGHLREILVEEPENVEARLELGKAMYESGDVPGAIAETNRILERNPNHVDALYNLGAIQGNLGRDDLARQYFTRAAAANPTSESGRKAKAALGQLSNTTPASLPPGHPPVSR